MDRILPACSEYKTQLSRIFLFVFFLLTILGSFPSDAEEINSYWSLGQFGLSTDFEKSYLLLKGPGLSLSMPDHALLSINTFNGFLDLDEEDHRYEILHSVFMYNLFNPLSYSSLGPFFSAGIRLNSGAACCDAKCGLKFNLSHTFDNYNKRIPKVFTILEIESGVSISDRHFYASVITDLSIIYYAFKEYSINYLMDR